MGRLILLLIFSFTALGVSGFSGAELYQCNSYKCECPEFQHHCPDTPWCINNWDACRPHRDACPLSSGRCDQLESCNMALCDNWPCVVIDSQPVCICEEGYYRPEGGVGCLNNQVAPCSIWGSCNLDCNHNLPMGSNCECPEGTAENTATNQCVIPATEDGIKLLGLDGFQAEAWSLPHGFKTPDIGFQIVESDDNNAVSLAVSLQNNRVFYAHNPSRMERYGKLYAHSFSDSKTQSDLLANVHFGTAGQMTYDWVNDNLYLVDTFLGQIMIVSGPSFQHSATIFSHGIISPMGIAVDPLERVMFYNDNAEENNWIVKCELDGSNGLVIEHEHLAYVVSLSVDVYNKYLYFADQAYSYIHAIDYFGRNRRVIIASDTHIRKLTSIDVFMDYVVFSDSTKNTLGVYSKWGNYTAGALEGDKKPLFIETGRGVKSVTMTHIAKEKKPLSSTFNPCSINNGGCAEICVPLRTGQSCLCAVGKKVADDGRSCKESDEFMILTELNSVRGISLDGSLEEPMVAAMLDFKSHFLSVDYDHESRVAFFTDFNLETVFMKPVDGPLTDESFVWSKWLYHPEGLSYDWTAKLLYIADYKYGTLIVVQPFKKQARALRKDLNSPKSLVVHPAKGYAYVVQDHSNRASIQRVELSGNSPPEDFVTEDLMFPDSVAIDFAGNRLYWTDASKPSIESVRLDGTNRRSLNIAPEHLTSPYGIAVHGNFVYWVDFFTSSIRRADLFTGQNAQVVHRGIESIDDITVFDATKQSIQSPCSINNGGCEGFCHPTPDGRNTCTCPYGYSLQGSFECVPNSEESSSCFAGFVSCRNGRCVREEYMCDGDNDCYDNTDESPDICTACSGSAIQCDNGRCVSNVWVCDGKDDCGDGTDESLAYCEMMSLGACEDDEFMCDNRECIDQYWRCDSHEDCLHGDDEEDCEDRECPENHVRCPGSSFLCIPDSYLCNGLINCPYALDEENCGPIACSDGEFACANGRQCIDAIWQCDRYDDCIDGSDELVSDCGENYEICLPHIHFECETSKHCIDLSFKCDGYADCTDFSDEADCPSNGYSSLSCGVDRFKCHSGECMWKEYKCDDVPDCADGSDESQCHIDSCDPETHWLCPSSSSDSAVQQCILLATVCNGIEDCAGGEDEHCIGGLCDINNGGCEQVCHNTPRGIVCSCHQGYHLDNGVTDVFTASMQVASKSCIDIDECASEEVLCSFECVNSDGSFECSCPQGYTRTADKKHCRVMDSSNLFMFLSSGNHLLSVVATDVYSLYATIDEEITNVIQLDRSQSGEAILVLSTETKLVIMEGGQITTTVPITEVYSKLAFDWINRKIYYLMQGTSNDDRILYMMEVDGTKKTRLAPMHQAQTLAVDPREKTSKVFYATMGGLHDHSGQIATCDLSGSGHTVILSQHVFNPVGMELDTMSDRVYWIDSLTNSIHYIHTNSDFPAKVFTVFQDSTYFVKPMGMQIFEEFVFWTDYDLGLLLRCDKNHCDGASAYLRSISRPRSFSIYHYVRYPTEQSLCESFQCDYQCAPQLSFATSQLEAACLCNIFSSKTPNGKECMLDYRGYGFFNGKTFYSQNISDEIGNQLNPIWFSKRVDFAFFKPPDNILLIINENTFSRIERYNLEKMSLESTAVVHKMGSLIADDKRKDRLFYVDPFSKQLKALQISGLRVHRVTLASLPSQHEYDEVSFLLFDAKLQIFFWFNKKMMRLYMHKFAVGQSDQIPVMSVTDKISLPEMPKRILCDEVNRVLVLEFDIEIFKLGYSSSSFQSLPSQPMDERSQSGALTGMALTSSGGVLFIDGNNVKSTSEGIVGIIPHVYTYDSILISIETGVDSEVYDDVCTNLDCGSMGICMKTENGAAACLCAQGASREDNGRLDSPCRADGIDVIFAFTESSGEESTLFKWAYNSSDSQQPEPFVTMEGNTVITDISCSFWGTNQGVFFTTHNQDADNWAIMKFVKDTEGVSSVVLDQNIGVFGIAQLTYDATLNRLYFANHFISHWSLEVLDLTLDKRIVLHRSSDGSGQCVALYYQNGYLFWLQDDKQLHYSLSDGSQMKVEQLLDQENVDISGYDETIYIAYKNLVERRQMENNEWTSKGTISISDGTVSAIFATSKLLYVAREDGVTELIDIDTWQKQTSEELTSTSIAFAGFCVDSDEETDPSGFTSICTENTDCDEFCFDVNSQVVCYCEHESKQVDASENCPETEIHVAISSGDSIEVIKGVHGTIKSLMKVDIDSSETSNPPSIESLSYSNSQDKIYAALGKTVKTLKISSQEVVNSVELNDKVLRVRVDDVENRAYVAVDTGHIEYYDLSLPLDQILGSRHLVISRIYASDFVVDYCYKNLYIASMNPVKIVKCSLDGGNFETIVDVFKVGHVTALALDRTVSRILYLFDSGKHEVLAVDLKSAAYNHEVIHKFDYEVEINSMDLRDKYLYFINPVKNAVQRIDVTVPGSLLNMQELPTGQDTHRLVALEPVQCPPIGLCQVYNGGCMDACHVASKHGQKEAVCECTHENQHLVTTIEGFCDWSNKTEYCADFFGSTSDLSCDYGMRCLANSQVCNGKQDCQDGSDENPGICASRTCNDNQFKCHNGQCIEANLECNHHLDCSDESDELYCDYKDQVCGENEFQCPGNFKCISNDLKCNHNDDCRNGLGSDETYGEPANCPAVECDTVYSFLWIFLDLTPCNDTAICIPTISVCDGNNDCGSNSDEENCDNRDCGKDFQCDNGRCVIYEEWVCDSYDDCGDLSDEKPSLCADVSCSEGEFKCANGNCIPDAYRCDSDNDCEDNSDEELPLVDCKTLECGANQIRCNNTIQSRKRCIDRSEICNHQADCEDAEDEVGCSNRPSCNADTQFTCDNQLCIPTSWYCDHDNDCGDGSDEPSNQCSYTDCTASEFRCNNGKCIPLFDHCDRMNDCLDQSDEMGCNYDGTVTCADDEVECPGQGSAHCIKRSKLCDGVNDCEHGSDEVNCGVNECEIATLNNCDHECVDEPSGYTCRCPPGMKTDSDNGHTCIDVDECNQYFKTCTHQCENSEGSYQCFCDVGYTLEEDENGNATICKHADNSPVYLLISDELSARLYDLHTRETTYVENEGDLIVAADFDYITEQVIYVDVTKKHIASISKDGSNRKVLINRDVPSGEGLAVDWIGRNFYWLDNRGRTLEVATIDGRYRKILTSNHLKEPRAIVVHPKKKMLFYTDWGYGNEHIGRMFMDGREQKKIITSRVSWPNALTIDYATEILFYADAHLNVIESFDLNGENRRVIMSSTASAPIMSHVFAMTVFDEFMYWTDWNLGTVTRADNRNGEKVEVIYQASKRPMDVHIWHRLRQIPIEVVDANGNKLPTYEESGCWIMLLTDNGGSDYVCDCPENLLLADDGKSCEVNCPLGHKSCDDASACYRSERYCDGFKDCFDGSDEPDTCPANPCEAGQLHCLGSNKCVEHSEICDGIEQCKYLESDKAEAKNDRTDEEDCEEYECPRGYFKCTNNKCINEYLKCNSVNDCHDNSDEDEELCGKRECDPHVEFRCQSGLCIPHSWECDVDHDCPDGDDEPSDCATRVANCQESDGMFSCHSNYRCIPDYMRCNQRDDCRDNSDEKDCETITCETGYFRCDNGLKCIPDRWKCDFNLNCADGSDETQETCGDNYRDCDPDLEFRCDNHKCVSLRDVCDTYNDCGDNSDENRTDCATLECHSDQFRCETSGHCIPDYKRCLNGIADCPDKSDEKNCEPRFPDGSYCLESMFECDNTVCIAQNEVCNTFDDCGDGSDEKHSQDRCISDNGHVNCDDEDLHPCGSGECVYKFHICNGVQDCSDGSDETEELCAHSCQQEGDRLSCHNRYQCFTENQACDTFQNCDDGTDELGCSTVSCDDENGGCEHYCNTTTTSSGDKTTFCSCEKGYEHDPDDAHKCVVKDFCKDWSTCSQTCVSHREGFDCLCTDDYKLSADRKVCKALGDPPVQMYVKGETIMRLVSHPTYYLDTETVEDAGDPKSMEFFKEPDNSLNLLFWLNQKSNSIHRSIIPGVNVKGKVEQSDKIEFKKKRKPERALTVDWIHNLLYFFEKDNEDKNLYNLVVSSVDGRYPRTLSKGFEDPRDVVVDPINGWLFIADVTSGVDGGGKIYKFEGMNTALKTIVDDSILDVHGLAIDFFKESRLYWSDFSHRDIFSVRHDGSDRLQLDMSGSGNSNSEELRLKPGALFVFEHEIYFYAEELDASDSPVSAGIYKRNKFIDKEAPISKVKGDTQSNTPFILFHAHARPTGLNRCDGNECSHLCLPVHKPENATARVCACPDGVSDPVDSSTCSYATEEWRGFKPCNGRGDIDKNLDCVCHDGYKGSFCQKSVHEKKRVIAATMSIFFIICAIILVVVFTPIPLKDKIRSRLFGQRGNDPVTFHVGNARANPGFDTHDNDRVTLGRDFPGFVDEDAMKEGVAPRVDFAFGQGGNSVAFSNPVFDIQQAQTAIQDFQPPAQTAGEGKPSAPDEKFSNDAVMSCSDVKVDFEADDHNKL